MAIDIYHSRRNTFNRCEFYTRDETADIEKLVHNKLPDGIFYAIEIAAIRSDKNDVGNVMRFDRNQITLKTGDDVAKLRPDDVVKYRGKLWIVSDLQYDIDIEESEFRREEQCDTIISLRR